MFASVSDDDGRPPQQLLHEVTHFQLPSRPLESFLMSIHESATAQKPYQMPFADRDEEIQYTRKLMENCATYDGTPEQLIAWLTETEAYLARENYPEAHHPFIIRHLLVDDALDYYLAHDHLVFNFSDLCKLFLHNPQVFASWRTVWSLNALASRETPRYLSSNRQQSTSYDTTLKHQENPVSSDDLPSPMPTDTLVCAHGESLRPPSDPSSTLRCQWCSASGHSARECSFLSLKSLPYATVSNSLSCKPSNPFVLDTPTPVDNTPTTPRMFSAPLLSSRDLRDNGLSHHLSLQNRTLDTSSVPSHQFIPPRTSLLGDRTPELFYGTPHWSVGVPRCTISGRRPPRRSRHSIPINTFRPPRNTGYAVIESFQDCALLATVSNHTSNYSEVASVCSDGPTACLSEALSTRSPSFSLEDAVLGSSSTEYLSSPLLPRHPPSVGSSHRFHAQHEKDYFLAKSISSSLSGGTPLSTLSNHTSPYPEVDSVWPDGPTEWLSEPLPPRSRPSLASHHYHPQHERAYVLEKSISSSVSRGAPVSDLSAQTVQYTAIDSVWADGPPEWLCEPLPPRSRPYLLDHDVAASTEPQCSSLQDPGTQIILPAAMDLMSSATAPITPCLIGSICSSTFRRQHLKNSMSSPRNYSPASRLFLLPTRPYLQLSSCARLSVLLLLFGFILTSSSFNFSTDHRYAAHELHPGWQIWHVMVP